MFINIQHPGDSGGPENPTETSTWPDGAGAGRPRPATVAIRREDGGVIGASFTSESPLLAATGADITAPLAVAGVTAMAAGAGIMRFRNRVKNNLSRTPDQER